MTSLLLLLAMASTSPQPIDRHALVSRHNVVLTNFDRNKPLPANNGPFAYNEMPMQVGNGEFAFGMDITGLQTFVPFNTMSQWGWHSSPLPAGVKVEDFKGAVVETHGRPVRYPLYDPDHPEISDWLAGNPHRINLGRLGFTIYKKDGSQAVPEDVQHPRQELDLWNGIVTSEFQIEGEAVKVKTVCDPHHDAIGVEVVSPLVQQRRLSIYLDVPGNDPRQFANFVGDWSRPAKLEELSSSDRRVDLKRDLDNDDYYITLQASQGQLIKPGTGPAPRPIKVLKAEYGAADKWIDVTALAAAKVAEGRLLMVGDNSLGDPILGVPKRLRVTVEINGHAQTVEAAENEPLIVESDPDYRRYTVRSSGESDALSASCQYAPSPIVGQVSETQSILVASQNAWPNYWKSGGAIDLSQSTDPRWKELERRIVLSQYLMKVNEAGSYPPQESGLVNNGWFGRFHLEMVWWHAAHWALWNRWNEVNRSFRLYQNILPQAMATAKSEGYEGARWPKCIGPNGVEWPHPIHSFLIWQQPHPIFFAELDYRAHPTKETLEKWRPVVEATADFMASYAFKEDSRYVLGPPLHLVSENTDPMVTQNPTYELSYWRFGLKTAQEWEKRLGRPENKKWKEVQNGLAPLPVKDGVYISHEKTVDMWTNFAFEHPALIGAYGMLPGDGVDRQTMKRTLDKVEATWDFNRTWGWDYPMLAMCAAKLGEPEKAVDFLLTSSPGFQFDQMGFASGGPFPYFPSNGGLLYAVAMMARGWDGSKGDAPGFPSSWHVRSEGLAPAP